MHHLFGVFNLITYICTMSKIVYISKEVMKAKKEELIIERNNAIMSCNYKKAEKLLAEIQKLNHEIYYK